MSNDSVIRVRSWHHARVQNLGRIAVLLVVLAACGQDTGAVVTPGVATTIVEDSSCAVDEVDGNLFMYNWPDYVDPALVQAFESEFEVEVVEDSYDSDAALFAKLQSGASYDLVVPSDHVVTELVGDGLLGRIQTEAVPNLRNLTTRFSDPSYDPGGEHSVAYTWGTVGLGLVIDDATEIEGSWAMVFDPEMVATYSAGVSLLDSPRHSIGAALKYLGYSLNSTSPDELEEAADLIAGLGDSSVTFNSESYDQLVESGAVTVAQGRSDRLQTESVGFVTPVEGAAIWSRAMAVPANAEHPCTAHTFINYLLQPENGAALATWVRQASPNRAALPFVDPVLLEDRSVYPSQEADRQLEFLEDLGDFEEEYERALAIARS